MENIAGTVTQTLVRRLQASTGLDDHAAQELALLPWRLEDYPARTDIAAEGEKPDHCCLVVSGFTIRHHLMRDGARQIQAINVAGDVPDLHSLFLCPMDHTFGTLSACRLAFVPHAALRKLCFDCPPVGAALWRETLIDASSFRASITRVAQLTARERIAHLICEMELRLGAVGLAKDGRFQFPVTQEELGDFLGLSTVQTNRSLQDLRSEGLLAVNRHDVHILQRERLQAVADFEPLYLHLSPED